MIHQNNEYVPNIPGTECQNCKNIKNRNRIGITVICILCVLLTISWCIVGINIYKSNKEKNLTVFASGDNILLTRTASDFMSQLTKLNFEESAHYTETPEMARYLTCDLTNNVIHDYADLFISSINDIEAAQKSDKYEEAVRMPIDFIKNNVSYKITGIKRNDHIYTVSLDLECIDIQKLLNQISDTATPTIGGEIVSDAVYYFVQGKSEDEYTTKDIDEIKTNASLDVAIDMMNFTLSNCKTEKISIDLNFIKIDNEFKLSKTTDMNFIRFFIM